MIEWIEQAKTSMAPVSDLCIRSVCVLFVAIGTERSYGLLHIWLNEFGVNRNG